MDIFSLTFTRKMIKLSAFLSAAAGFFGAVAALLFVADPVVAVATFIGGLVGAAMIMAVVHTLDFLERIARNTADLCDRLDEMIAEPAAQKSGENAADGLVLRAERV